MLLTVFSSCVCVFWAPVAGRTGSSKTLAFLVSVLDILYCRRWGADGLVQLGYIENFSYTRTCQLLNHYFSSQVSIVVGSSSFWHATVYRRLPFFFSWTCHWRKEFWQARAFGYLKWIWISLLPRRVDSSCFSISWWIKHWTWHKQFTSVR